MIDHLTGAKSKLRAVNRFAEAHTTLQDSRCRREGKLYGVPHGVSQQLVTDRSKSTKKLKIEFKS